MKQMCSVFLKTFVIYHFSQRKSLDFKNLMALSRCKKVRTILIKEQLGKTALFPLLDRLSNQLKYLRFLSCGFTTLNVLPESVANFNLLRCLKLDIPRRCIFESFPDSFCSLYHLQMFEALNCHFEKFPRDFRYLTNLQFFRAKTFCYERHHTVLLQPSSGVYIDVSLLKNFNLQGVLHLKLGNVRVADAAQIELNKRSHIHGLILDFHSCDGSKDQELLEVLCPHQDIEYLKLEYFSGVIMPTWFEPTYLQRLGQLRFRGLRVLTIAWANNDTDQAGFSSLTELHISLCRRVSSLDHILQPGSLPSIKTIWIEECDALSSISAQRFGGFSCLEELKVQKCQQIQWIGLVLPPSLVKLQLEDCGDLSDSIPNCLLNLDKLIQLSLMSVRLRSIPAHLWAQKLSKLESLEISCCPELISIGGSEGLEHIANVFVESCPQLKDLRQPLKRGRRPFLTSKSFSILALCVFSASA
uniref:Uncharacterized protein n=1 Tax=Avena sativa TaxID=4498 RepID=A0ACD5Z956_AVESA